MASADPGRRPLYTGTLTPEHLAVIHAERDRWLRIGLLTTPADRPAAEAAVRRAYAAAGFQPPNVVVWMDSPLGGCLATATLHQLHGQLRGRLDGKLDRAPLWRQLADQPGRDLLHRLRDQLRGQLQGQLIGRLGGRQPGGRLHDQLEVWLWVRLRDQLRDQLGDLFWDQLDGQLRRQLDDQLGHEFYDPLLDQLQDQLGGWLGDQLWGQLDGRQRDQFNQWDAPWWLARDRCGLRVAGLAPSPQLEALADAVASVGWWWPLRGAVVLTDRPTSIARDGRGRLHPETGPALACAYGYTLHAIHGVRVPAQVVEAPETITVDQIRGERNVEVRRVLLERYGHQRYLRDAGAERVHADDTGTLWRCELPDDEPLVMVEVTNATPEPDGTHRAYWLRVPPQLWTARQAVAW